jgi:hypothetical protein
MAHSEIMTLRKRGAGGRICANGFAAAALLQTLFASILKDRTKWMSIGDQGDDRRRRLRRAAAVRAGQEPDRRGARRVRKADDRIDEILGSLRTE